MLINAKVTTEIRRVGRPRLELDEGVIARLAGRGCSTRAIASILDCSEDTLQRRFAALIRKSWAGGKIGLRCAQFELAMKGNSRMLIWLGKQYLGQSNSGARDAQADPAGPPLSLETDQEIVAPRIQLERAG